MFTGANDISQQCSVAQRPAAIYLEDSKTSSSSFSYFDFKLPFSERKTSFFVVGGGVVIGRSHGGVGQAETRTDTGRSVFVCCDNRIAGNEAFTTRSRWFFSDWRALEATLNGSSLCLLCLYPRKIREEDNVLVDSRI